jgi:hypothetical protein
VGVRVSSGIRESPEGAGVGGTGVEARASIAPAFHTNLSESLIET